MAASPVNNWHEPCTAHQTSAHCAPDFRLSVPLTAEFLGHPTAPPKPNSIGERSRPLDLSGSAEPSRAGTTYPCLHSPHTWPRRWIRIARWAISPLLDLSGSHAALRHEVFAGGTSVHHPRVEFITRSTIPEEQSLVTLMPASRSCRNSLIRIAQAGPRGDIPGYAMCRDHLRRTRNDHPHHETHMLNFTVRLPRIFCGTHGCCKRPRRYANVIEKHTFPSKRCHANHSKNFSLFVRRSFGLDPEQSTLTASAGSFNIWWYDLHNFQISFIFCGTAQAESTPGSPPQPAAHAGRQSDSPYYSLALHDECH